jgi:hypothetical protein
MEILSEIWAHEKILSGEIHTNVLEAKLIQNLLYN